MTSTPENEDNLFDVLDVNITENRSRRRSSLIKTISSAVRNSIVGVRQRSRSFSSGNRASMVLAPFWNHNEMSYSLQEEKERNQELEEYLRKEKVDYEKIVHEPTMIVLGSSDSGKTTLLKQMKILHGLGFTDDEKQAFLAIMRKGIVTYISTLMEMITEYEYRNVKQKYADLIEFRQDFEKGYDEMTPDRLLQFQNAWKEPVIQEKFASESHNLPDSARFFIEKMEKVFQENYQPTNEDILKIRSSTVSVSDTVFDIEGKRLHVIDVNGFSHGRHTWLKYFDNLSCVLFVAPLSSYDQVMVEEADVNRMVDSIVLFQDLANNKQLEDKQFILFLNKKDIYERKIKTRNIIDYFPGYKGAPGDAAQGIKYFESKFLDKNIVSKQVMTHVTCCVDTEFMNEIISSVIQTVLMERVQDTKLI